MNKNQLPIIILLTIILSFFFGSYVSYLILTNQDKSTNTIIPTINYTSTTLNETNTISDGVNKIYDAVVVVEGFTKNKLTSTGTGFIYKKEKDTAYIMTNYHVINGAEKVQIILSDKTVLDVEVKGGEAYSDIAVLSVKSDKITSVAILGESSKLNVGDTLFAIGSPEGSNYAGSVTKGVLSGKERLVAVALSNSQNYDYYMKVLQTDAAINPGNSGGPICNINGEVIGVTNMKLVDDNVEGIGFAIPIEDALLYATTLEKGENIKRPFLGIGMSEITDGYYLWQNGIILPDNVKHGVVITEVTKNSTAEFAKLKKGDIIIELAGVKIHGIAELRYELYKHNVGETIKIKYIRSGKEKTIEVKLIEKIDS